MPRLLQYLGARSVAIEALDVRTKTGQRIDFTIGIGYTCADTRQMKITNITTAGFAFERLFGVADRALYTAKNSGRNCVATSEIFRSCARRRSAYWYQCHKTPDQ